MKFYRICCLFLLANGFLFSSASSWNVNGNGVWDTASNWNPAAVPDDVTASVTFGDISTASTTVNVNGAFSVNSISFDNPFTYILSNGSLVVTDQVKVFSGGAAHEIGSSLSLFAAPFSVSFLNDSDNILTVSGTIVGGSFPKVIIANGTVVFSGANTYTGDTSISGGLLRISADQNLGDATSSLIFESFWSSGTLQTTATFSSARTVTMTSNGTVNTDPATTLTLSGIIGGTSFGRLTKEGTGTLILTGTNTYPGGTTVSAGTLEGTTTSLQGAIENNNIVNFNQTTTGTYSGVMSGTGALQKNGTGTVTLSGTNRYLGGTTVSAGTLQGTTNSLQGAITVDNATTLTFNQAFKGIYSGAISGAGALTKEGAGTLQMINNSPAFTGTTTLNGGELNLNGSLAGAVIVNGGTTLSGNATMTNLTNNGTVSPGNSIGTTTVNGNFVQNASGNLIVEIDHNGNTDLLAITGTATLNLGGTLTLSPLPGIYTGEEIYTFLTAAGGLGGTTFTIKASTTGSPYDVLYFGTFAQIDFNHRGAILPVPISDLPSNARKIANYLFCTGSIPDTPDLLAVLRQLVTLPPHEFIRELDQLSPMQFGALPLTVLQNSHLMADTFVSNAEKFYWCDTCGTSNTARTKMTDTAVWLAPLGQWHTQKAVQDQLGFNTRTYGGTAGVSHLFSTFLNLTVGAGYAHTTLGWQENGGDGHWNSAYLAPSIGIVNKRWFVNLLAQGAVNFFNIDRKIRFTGLSRTAHNHHNSYDVLGRFDGGYKFRWNGANAPTAFYFMPIARLSYLSIFEEGYTESGANSLNLSVDNKYSGFLQPEVLFKFIREFYPKDFCITPTAHLGYIANIPLSSGTYTSHLHKQALCQSEFSVESFHRITSQLVVGFGLRVNKKSWGAFDLSYEGRLLDDIYVNEAKVKLDVEF